MRVVILSAILLHIEDLETIGKSAGYGRGESLTGTGEQRHARRNLELTSTMSQKQSELQALCTAQASSRAGTLALILNRVQEAEDGRRGGKTRCRDRVGRRVE